MRKWLIKKIFKKEIKTHKEQMQIARDKLVELIEENKELREEIQELNEMMELYEKEIEKLEREKMIDDIIVNGLSKILQNKKRR